MSVTTTAATSTRATNHRRPIRRVAKARRKNSATHKFATFNKKNEYLIGGVWIGSAQSNAHN